MKVRSYLLTLIKYKNIIYYKNINQISKDLKHIKIFASISEKI